MLKKDLVIAILVSSLPFILSCIESFTEHGNVVGVFVNFLYFGLYPIVFVGLLTLFKIPKYSCTAISIVILAQYIIYFFLSRSDTNGLVWLGYFFTIPGLLIGAITACYITLRKIPSNPSPFIFFAIALFLTALGFALNQLLLCNTVMYCGFNS